MRERFHRPRRPKSWYSASPFGELQLMSLPRALAVVGFVTFLAAARGASSSPTSEPPPPTPLARMGGGINVTRLVADLDNDDFTEREKATMELAKRGRIVEAELRQAYE